MSSPNPSDAMLRSAPRQTGKFRSQPASKIPAVCVVDPQADKYQGCHAFSEWDGVQLQLVASAEEALRLARATAIDLWLINVELPGLSGVELCGMLRQQGIRAAISLVADEYSPEAERTAYLHRATTFCCKAGLPEFLKSWRAAREEKFRGPLKTHATES